MSSPVILITAMPLECYWAYLPEGNRPSLESLRELARDRKLIGTYKQGREWWINLLAHGQMGLESGPKAEVEDRPEVIANEEIEIEESTGKAEEGNRRRVPKREHVVRSNPKGRRIDPDGRVRIRR
jgi:hypothetical protein